MSDWVFAAPNQVDFLAQRACGKALCKFELPTSPRTHFENSWTLNNINFLNSSPRRPRGQPPIEDPGAFGNLTRVLRAIVSGCSIAKNKRIGH